MGGLRNSCIAKGTGEAGERQTKKTKGERSLSESLSC
jgi:hypothetical protein